METLGSVMENYHKRFSNGDSDFDDKRLQKEMFVKLNGPPLLCCDLFIKKVLFKYRQKIMIHLLTNNLHLQGSQFHHQQF